MSRFSLAEAKGLGWKIVHENPKGEGGKPKSIVAEKVHVTPLGNETLVHEEAHSMGLLLERVFQFEHLHQVPVEVEIAPEPEVEPEPEADVEE